MIDTHVAGDPGSVRAGATWLRGTLRSGLDASADHQSDARSSARGGWEGAAGEAYQSVTRSIVAATDAHAARVGRAATALEDYAARLDAMQATMAALRSRATEGGLSVAGDVVQPPPDVPAGVVEPGSPEELARQRAIAKVELYNELVADATDAWARFRDWIEGHLPADVADARDKDDVAKLNDAFTDAVPSFGVGVGAGLTGLAIGRLGDDYAARAREFRRRSRVSGDPRVRGQADTPAGRAQVDDWLGRARGLRRFGRILSGPAGIGIDVYFGYQEAQETGDWTRAALTTGGSIATGLGVGALVAAGVVTAPAWAVVVGGGALAAGVAWGVGEIYDNWDDITEWTGDRVDDVADFASDTWDSATDVAGDAWDAVTPW